MPPKLLVSSTSSCMAGQASGLPELLQLLHGQSSQSHLTRRDLISITKHHCILVYKSPLHSLR
uniref:Uncharacterized protein n=1 Tax=Kalanchoe fedtschenkoi TaxID=63787 RepID=A0A7N0TLA4_KALFE